MYVSLLSSFCDIFIVLTGLAYIDHLVAFHSSTKDISSTTIKMSDNDVASSQTQGNGGMSQSDVDFLMCCLRNTTGGSIQVSHLVALQSLILVFVLPPLPQLIITIMHHTFIFLSIKASLLNLNTSFSFSRFTISPGLHLVALCACKIVARTAYHVSFTSNHALSYPLFHIQILFPIAD